MFLKKHKYLTWKAHLFPNLPEVISSTQLPAKFVVKPAAHLPQAAAAEVTAKAILMPVLLDSLEEEAVPDVLLTPAARQQ